MIETPTPCITVSVRPGHQVLTTSASFRELVNRTFREEEEVRCSDLLSCGGHQEASCGAESCPLAKVYRSEDKFLENVALNLRSGEGLVPTTANFCALWEPWGSYVSVWFGPVDAYE